MSLRTSAGSAPAELADDGRDDVVVTALDAPEALAAVAIATSNPGGRVLVSASLPGLCRVVERIEGAGRSVSTVDPADVAAVGRAVDATSQVLLVEALTDAPHLVDLLALGQLCLTADIRNILLVIDNGRLSRWVLRPEAAGAALDVRPVSSDPTLTEVGGERFAMSLVRRHLGRDGVATFDGRSGSS